MSKSVHEKDANSVIAECDVCHKRLKFVRDGVNAVQLRMEKWLYCPLEPCNGKIREVKQ